MPAPFLAYKSCLMLSFVCVPALNIRASHALFFALLARARAFYLSLSLRVCQVPCGGLFPAEDPEYANLSDEELVRRLWATAPVTPVPSSHPLFVSYTSGSTGKPKGVVHVHGG